MELNLREFAQRVLEIAKQNLQADGCLIPIAFIVGPEGTELVQLSFQNHEEKECEYQELVRLAHEKNASAIVTVNDAYYAHRPNDLQEYVEGYYPGRLADEGSPECIMLTLSGPAFATWEVRVPYERTKEGIVFGAHKETTGGDFPFLEGWAGKGSSVS